MDAHVGALLLDKSHSNAVDVAVDFVNDNSRSWLRNYERTLWKVVTPHDTTSKAQGNQDSHLCSPFKIL